MKNKIGWCNLTFNPVWGCRNHCEYCYAWGINRRFWAKMLEIERNYHFKKHQSWAWTGDQLRGLHDFRPTFLDAQFDKKFPQKTQKIFVGSMSEIAHWEKRWMEVVLGKILCYPKHIFQFLTKYPEVYMKYDFPKNCWLGVTITHLPKYEDANRWDFNSFIRNEKINNLKFVSFEPLLEDIHPYTYLNFDREIGWVIFGAETGNRRGKIIPKREWIKDIVNYCRYKDIPVYLKDSLKDIYPVEIKEFPKTEL